jgi:hypothetical protein
VVYLLGPRFLGPGFLGSAFWGGSLKRVPKVPFPTLIVIPGFRLFLPTLWTIGLDDVVGGIVFPDLPLFTGLRATTFIGFPHFGQMNGPSSGAILLRNKAVAVTIRSSSSQPFVTHFTVLIIVAPVKVSSSAVRRLATVPGLR